MTPADFVTGAMSASAAFKTIFTSLGNILAIAQDVKVKAAVAALQGVVGDTQSAYLALQEKYQLLLEENLALKAECHELKEFHAKASRYKMVSPVPGFTVYALKKDDANGDPPHWLCPHCMHEGKIGLLQTSWGDSFDTRAFSHGADKHLVCGSCKTEFVLPRDVFDASWGKFA